MESTKNKQNTSNLNIIALHNCHSSDSDSENNNLNAKFNNASSFDSNDSLEVSDASNDYLNENQNSSNNEPGKLSSIPEILNEEESSSMIDLKETDSKRNFMELVKYPQQNREKIINNIQSKVVISPILNYENKNIHQENSYINKENEYNRKKSNVNEISELEVDGDIIRVTRNQCICTSCKIF